MLHYPSRRTECVGIHGFNYPREFWRNSIIFQYFPQCFAHGHCQMPLVPRVKLILFAAGMTKIPVFKIFCDCCIWLKYLELSDSISFLSFIKLRLVFFLTTQADFLILLLTEWHVHVRAILSTFNIRRLV